MKLSRWHGSFILAAILLLARPALAQEEGERWEWKAFAPGKTVYQSVTTETAQVMKVMGQEVRQTQVQTFFFRLTGQAIRDGNFVVRQEIIGVKMQIDVGGNKIVYDSTDDQNADNALTAFFKKLIGTELTLTIDARTLKIKHLTGHEEMLKNLGDTNPQMQPVLKSILSKDALVQMAEPTWGAFPTMRVKKGSTWTNSTTLNMGPIGTYDTKYRHRYVGPQPDGEKIRTDIKLTYAPPKEAGGALPFKIRAADIKTKESDGESTFDRARGRFTTSRTVVRLEGSLTIEVGGNETMVELSQQQNTRVTWFDDNPLKK